MLSKNLLDEINTQIKLELYSGYLYLAMAAHFEEANWGGFASWMKKQAAEEQEHALKFFGYIHDRGGKVMLAGHRPAPDKLRQAGGDFRPGAQARAVRHRADQFAVRHRGEGQRLRQPGVRSTGLSRSRWKKKRMPLRSLIGSRRRATRPTRFSRLTDIWQDAGVNY